MAKYADYVKDQLTSEIDEASQAATDRQDQAPDNSFEVPEKFKGKSLEDVARSYVELEKAYSRQGQDHGKLRQTVDELMALQSQMVRGDKTEPVVEKVTVDQLYEDTDATIRRVARAETDERISALEAELARARVEVRVNKLNEQFKDWRGQIASPEFQNWVAEQPYRARLYQAADSYDLDAAEDLLSMWYDRNKAATQADKERRSRDLRNASLETSGPEAAHLETVFSRRELADKRIAAIRGDVAAKRFLQDNADAIAFAYEDGRIVD